MFVQVEKSWRRRKQRGVGEGGLGKGQRLPGAKGDEAEGRPGMTARGLGMQPWLCTMAENE